jgi:hypothetical protein
MVHLPYTAINFAAVMSAVRLKVQTCRAERRSAVIVADKDVFQLEVLHPWLKTVLEAGAALIKKLAEFTVSTTQNTSRHCTISRRRVISVKWRPSIVSS